MMKKSEHYEKILGIVKKNYGSTSLMKLTTTIIAIAFMAQVYFAMPAAAETNLVAYWGFNETAGTVAADSSGNGNSAILMNGPVWITGKSGKALQFDGINDYAVKKSAIGIPAKSPFTVLAWVNGKSFSNPKWSDIIRKEGSWAVQIGPTNKINLEITGKQDTISNVVVPINTWTRIAVTFEGTTVKYYKNGVLGDTKTQANIPNAGLNTIDIGGYTSWGTYLNGALDQVKIYNRALSAAEISADYSNSGTPTPTPAPTSTPLPQLTPTPTPTPSPTPAPTSGLLIRNIAAATGKAYVQDTLAVGKLLYIDRTYKFTTVPASYNGLNYIKTATDDRYDTRSNFLQFDVNQNVNVYVAYDDRISSKPSWLTSSFTDTGANLVRDGSVTFSIYVRAYPSGHVSLGGNSIPSGGAGGMYVVIVKPLGSAPLPQQTPTPTPTPAPTPTPSPTGKTYNVAKDGSGNFKTIQEAANVAVAGDIVYVKAGTYNEYVTVKNSGSAGKPITFKALGTVTVTYAYSSMPAWSGLFWIKNKQHITIDGFRLIGGYTCIDSDASSNIIIRNNYCENPQNAGIKVGWGYSNNVIVTNNIVNRFASPSTLKYNEMISISNTHNSEIRNNHVKQNSLGEAIVIKDASSFVKVYNNLGENSKLGVYVGGCVNGGTHDIEIYNNIAVGNSEGITSACESGGKDGSGPVRNLNFHDNFAANNEAEGIGIGTWAGSGYFSWQENIVFRNNRACNNGWKNFLFDGFYSGSKVTGLVIEGNTAPSPCVIPSFT